MASCDADQTQTMVMADKRDPCASCVAAACKDIDNRRASSSCPRPVSKTGQPRSQGTRRSQRQQQQRQLKDQHLQAERQHIARISARAKTPVAVAAPSSTVSSTKTVTCAVVSCSKSSVHLAEAARSFSNENAQQREVSKGTTAKAPAGNATLGRQGKGSPPAGVKKQVSPMGKSSLVGLGLGGRFPLRVRKNADQSHAKGDLNGKFAQAGHNRGLGDLAAHMAPRITT